MMSTADDTDPLDDFYDTSQDHLFLYVEPSEDPCEYSQNALQSFSLSPANPNLAQEGTRNTADNDNTFDEQDETPQIPSAMSLTYLKKFFGFSKFRPLQYEIIDAALNKHAFIDREIPHPRHFSTHFPDGGPSQCIETCRY